MRHDAHQCRVNAKSERIRHEHGWLTPEEEEAKKKADAKRRSEEMRLESLGMSLFQEGE